MTRILLTDHGPHLPEKWATTTAEVIFDIDPKMDGPRLIQAQKLQLAIVEALIPHHVLVQYDEKNKLATDSNHIAQTHNADDYLDKALDAVVAVSKGTPWEAHFANSTVQTVVKNELAHHFMTSQHIERLWYADRNPSNEVAQNYKSQFHKRGV